MCTCTHVHTHTRTYTHTHTNNCCSINKQWLLNWHSETYKIQCTHHKWVCSCPNWSRKVIYTPQQSLRVHHHVSDRQLDTLPLLRSREAATMPTGVLLTPAASNAIYIHVHVGLWIAIYKCMCLGKRQLSSSIGHVITSTSAACQFGWVRVSTQLKGGVASSRQPIAMNKLFVGSYMHWAYLTYQPRLAISGYRSRYLLKSEHPHSISGHTNNVPPFLRYS